MLAVAMSDDPFELSREETQVMLGRFAGASVADLSATTGMPATEVASIVAKLASLGLIGDEPEEAPRPVTAPPPARERGWSAPPIEPVAIELEPHAEDDLVALLDAAMHDLLPPALPPHVSRPPAAATEALPPRRTPPRMTPATRRRLEEEAEADAEAPPLPPEAEAAPEPSDDDRAAAEAEKVEDTREYHKLFEAKLHPLPVEQRVALAGTAQGAELFALCFDPAAAVIMALFDNTAASVEHARLVAFHHRDPRGLERVMAQPGVARDPLVQRRLLRNPALPEAALRRLLSQKRLMEIHKLTLDRDVPDRSRTSARHLLRTRYMTAPAEERVDLVWATEARVLAVLVGCTFDSRMTSILCSRTYASVMMVQNLARFPATPPALLAYLMRQPIVKRQQHLRNAILQHPNTPSEAKRRV
jgi:hypothetical protein